MANEPTEAPNNDYPKMLYKSGSEIDVDGAGYDTITVEDATAEKAARTDGYADLADAAKPAKPAKAS